MGFTTTSIGITEEFATAISQVGVFPHATVTAVAETYAKGSAPVVIVRLFSCTIRQAAPIWYVVRIGDLSSFLTIAVFSRCEGGAVADRRRIGMGVFTGMCFWNRRVMHYLCGGARKVAVPPGDPDVILHPSQRKTFGQLGLGNQCSFNGPDVGLLDEVFAAAVSCGVDAGVLEDLSAAISFDESCSISIERPGARSAIVDKLVLALPGVLEKFPELRDRVMDRGAGGIRLGVHDQFGAVVCSMQYNFGTATVLAMSMVGAHNGWTAPKTDSCLLATVDRTDGHKFCTGFPCCVNTIEYGVPVAKVHGHILRDQTPAYSLHEAILRTKQFRVGDL